MPRNYPANPKKIWTPASMELAVKEHIEDGVRIRNVTKKYKIPSSSISRHVIAQVR